MENNCTEDGFCKFGGWCSEFPESHIIRATYFNCEYISSLYDISFDDNGEVIFTKKIKQENNIYLIYNIKLILSNIVNTVFKQN